AFDMARDVADVLDIGDGSATELHHQAGHGGLADYSDTIAMRDQIWASPRAKRRVYITADPDRRNCAPGVDQCRPMPAQSAAPPSTRRQSGISRHSPRSGGTSAVPWPCCTSSTRCGSDSSNRL